MSHLVIQYDGILEGDEVFFGDGRSKNSSHQSKERIGAFMFYVFYLLIFI